MHAAVCVCVCVCVRSYIRVRVCVCVCVRTPALASLLPSLQPPHSDSPVTEGLTTSHALPVNSPAPLASLYLHPRPRLTLCPLLCLPPQLYFLIHPSVHYLSLSFHPPLFLSFCFVFISHPLIWCVGLPCLPSCSLRPQCCLSLSLWKPRVDKSGSEVCETD